MDRRRFITQSGIAAASLALTATKVAAAPVRATTPLRMLILGATGFIGPHFVHAARERGHHVSAFIYARHKDKDIATLPADVEPLLGDRNGDLESIRNRDWDAVLDLATYGPLWVRTLGQAIQDRTRHYTFISTVSVYQFPAANDEDGPVLEYTDGADPYSSATGPYGEFKVLCEREAQRQFSGRTLVLRPGAIVGPGDNNGAFTYWPVRMAHGGEALVAGDPLAQVQFIDVRDLAVWSVHMAEQQEKGIINAIGPALGMGWAEMLGAIRGTSSIPVKLTWIPSDWLRQEKVPAGSAVMFWSSEAGSPRLMHLSNARALAKGLTFRPVGVTAADTLAWYKAQPREIQDKLVLGFDGLTAFDKTLARERQLLDEWSASPLNRAHVDNQQGSR